MKRRWLQVGWAWGHSFGIDKVCRGDNLGGMPKPSLKEPFASLENNIIDTFLAGHHEWRPDLPYPESHSDMSGGARALMRMFEIKRRPVAISVAEMISDHDQGELITLIAANSSQ